MVHNKALGANVLQYYYGSRETEATKESSDPPQAKKPGSKPLLLRLRNTISSHGFSYDKNEEKYLVKVADFVQNTHGDDVIKTHFVATTDKKKNFFWRLLLIVRYPIRKVITSTVWSADPNHSVKVGYEPAFI